jgi:hypothetical protein
VKGHALIRGAYVLGGIRRSYQKIGSAGDQSEQVVRYEIIKRMLANPRSPQSIRAEAVEENGKPEKNAGVARISAGAPAEGLSGSRPSEEEKLVKTSSPAASKKPSEASWEASSGSVMNLDFIP